MIVSFLLFWIIFSHLLTSPREYLYQYLFYNKPKEVGMTFKWYKPVLFEPETLNRSQLFLQSVKISENWKKFWTDTGKIGREI